MPLLSGPTGRTGAACAPTAAGWPLCTENQIRKTASIKAIWIKSSPVERLHSERGGRRARNAIMQRLLAAVLAVACVVGSTPGFARGAGHGFGRGGFLRGPPTPLSPPPPQCPPGKPRSVPLSA